MNFDSFIVILRMFGSGNNHFRISISDVLLDLVAALAAMVLVDSNKEVVGATGHISTRPVLR